MIENPCEKCKRRECPSVCFPKKDYERALINRNITPNYKAVKISTLHLAPGYERWWAQEDDRFYYMARICEMTFKAIKLEYWRVYTDRSICASEPPTSALFFHHYRWMPKKSIINLKELLHEQL